MSRPPTVRWQRKFSGPGNVLTCFCVALALLSSRIKEGHQGLEVANVETVWYSTLVITITEKDPKRVREGGGGKERKKG